MCSAGSGGTSTSARALRQIDLDAVAEPRPRSHGEVRARRLVPELTEAHHDRTSRAQRARGAGRARSCHVRRASACSPEAHTSPPRSPRRREPQAVVDRDRRRLVGEPGPVHRPEQPVAAAVAGEHPAGAVRAVRGRARPSTTIRAAGRRTRAPADPSTSRRGTRRASRRRPPRATRRGAGRPGSRRPHMRAWRAASRRSTVGWGHIHGHQEATLSATSCNQESTALVHDDPPRAARPDRDDRQVAARPGPVCTSPTRATTGRHVPPNGSPS